MLVVGAHEPWAEWASQLHEAVRRAFVRADASAVAAATRRIEQARQLLREVAQRDAVALLRALSPMAERIVLSGRAWTEHAAEWRVTQQQTVLSDEFALGGTTRGGRGGVSAGGAFRLPERLLVMDRALGVCDRLPRDRDASGAVVTNGLARALAPPAATSECVAHLSTLAALCDAGEQSVVDGAAELMGVRLVCDARRVTAVRDGEPVGSLRHRDAPQKYCRRMHTTSLGNAIGVPAVAHNASHDPLLAEARDCRVLAPETFGLPAYARGLTSSPGPEVASRVEMLLFCKLFELARARGSACVFARVRRDAGGALDAKHAAFLALGPKFVRGFARAQLRQHPLAELFVSDPLVVADVVPFDYWMVRPVPSAPELRELVALCLTDHPQFAAAYRLRADVRGHRHA